MAIKKVIILLNRGKKYSKRIAKILEEELSRRGVRREWVDCLDPFSDQLPSFDPSICAGSDLIITCGGDGTLLQAAHRSKGTGIPVLGINIGYLGFITSIQGNQINKDIDRILCGEFIVSKRSAIDVKIENKGRLDFKSWALNDAVITRGDHPHLIGLQAYVGDRQLTNYRCDGLIVATPTGSTAYSLAAGGPIVSPECQVLVITPICPHALTNRSVVISAKETIRLTPAPQSGLCVVQVDGMEVARVGADSVICVNISKHTVPVAYLPEINFYTILGEKLKWSGDGLSN